MKILIISDGHGAIEMLDRIESVAQKADLVLFGGDFAEFNKPETAQPYLEKLAALHDRVFSVSGNCDEMNFHETMDKYDLCIEGSLSYFNGLMLTGSGGALEFTGTTPNERSDEELISDLYLVSESVPLDSADVSSSWNNLVVVAHNPPKDTALDVVGNGIHAGSPLLREFIETYKPLLVVSGHIHESRAIDTLGPTTLVNPGALFQGNYAIAEITGGRTQPFAISSIQLCTL